MNVLQRRVIYVKKSSKAYRLASIIALVVTIISAVATSVASEYGIDLFSLYQEPQPTIDLTTIPQFNDVPYVALYDNVPDFNEEELTSDSFEEYSELDYLGRVGMAVASIGVDIMPTEDRESIGMIKPTGWQTAKYEHVEGDYLYNRCHLIGFQLTGENANELNLMTGTRYMNVDGMLPFENMIADYVKETHNHVLYRVIPHYVEEELVARGVQLEAYSIEDAGAGVSFNVFVYNNQPGIVIDYATGNSSEVSSSISTSEDYQKIDTYILNLSSKKYHEIICPSVETIAEHNYQEYTGTIDELHVMGYASCNECFDD